LKVLLADPPFRVQHKKYVIPNLGLGYLAACVLNANHEVRVFNASFHDRPFEAFDQQVTSFRPNLIGFSAPTCKITQAAQLAKRAKDLAPGVRTLIGGWHVTAVPKETMAMFPGFDLAITSEGEDAVMDLIPSLEGGGDLATIPGLLWRRDREVIFNEPRRTPTDMTALPLPAWDLMDLRSTAPMYRKSSPGSLDYPLMTKRGCPYRCIFCKEEGNERVRWRTDDDVFDEIHMARERWHADGIQLFDETFTLSTQRTERFCNRILEEGLHRELLWNCCTRVDCVSRSSLALMKESGCCVIQFGVESGVQEVLDANRKQITLDQCRQAVTWCRELGLLSDVSFVFGLPFDNRLSVRETARFSRDLDPDFVSYFTFIPYPGTPASDLARRGEANLKMLHSNYERFEQQYSAPCELGDFSGWRLTLLRFVSYARFYFRPQKWHNLLTMLDLRTLPMVFMKALADSFFGRSGK